MTLHPDLLRACAAYLAHADTYDLDEPGVLALLRAEATPSRRPQPVTVAARSILGGQDPRPTPDEIDEMTRAHLDAIEGYAVNRAERPTQSPRLTRADVSRQTVKLAYTILDATPGMLAWWCDALVREAKR